MVLNFGKSPDSPAENEHDRKDCRFKKFRITEVPDVEYVKVTKKTGADICTSLGGHEAVGNDDTYNSSGV